MKFKANAMYFLLHWLFPFRDAIAGNTGIRPFFPTYYATTSFLNYLFFHFTLNAQSREEQYPLLKTLRLARIEVIVYICAACDSRSMAYLSCSDFSLDFKLSCSTSLTRGLRISEIMSYNRGCAYCGHGHSSETRYGLSSIISLTKVVTLFSVIFL